MFRSFLIKTAVASALVLGMSGGTLAQQTSDATQDAKKAGEKAKDAAKDGGEAAKDAAKATGKATKSAAKTVKKKLTPDTTSATCKDGTVQTGKTKTTACIDHGGVRN